MSCHLVVFNSGLHCALGGNWLLVAMMQAADIANYCHLKPPFFRLSAGRDWALMEGIFTVTATSELAALQYGVKSGDHG